MPKKFNDIEPDTARTKDKKKERETKEKVLDRTSLKNIQKLIGQNFIKHLEGCLATGKEANVYFARGKDNQDYALKIFKTANVSFQQRQEYVFGDKRFPGSYSKMNPRKKVQLWAEKEFRNLMRAYTCGVRVPKPIILKPFMILMEFIGRDGLQAPRLKDVQLADQTQWDRVYRDTLQMYWHFVNEAKLIHGDLSEYNILYLDDEVVFIDVSQAVEHDHPQASAFLRRDLATIASFFANKAVPTLSLEIAYDFIRNISFKSLEHLRESLADICANEANWTSAKNSESEDAVFKSINLPSRLTDIKQNRDGSFKLTDDPLVNDLIQKTMLASVSDADSEVDESESESESGSESASDSDEDDGSEKLKKLQSRPKNESLDEKKERKKALRDEKALKRQNKMKKHVKKRLCKETKQKRSK